MKQAGRNAPLRERSRGSFEAANPGRCARHLSAFFSCLLLLLLFSGALKGGGHLPGARRLPAELHHLVLTAELEKGAAVRLRCLARHQRGLRVGQRKSSVIQFRGEREREREEAVTIDGKGVGCFQRILLSVSGATPPLSSFSEARGGLM